MGVHHVDNRYHLYPSSTLCVHVCGGGGVSVIMVPYHHPVVSINTHILQYCTSYLSPTGYDSLGVIITIMYNLNLGCVMLT